MKRYSLVILVLAVVLSHSSSSAQSEQKVPLREVKLVEVTLSTEAKQSVERSKQLRTPAEQKMTSSLLEISKQFSLNGNTFQKDGLVKPQSVGSIHAPSNAKVDELNRVYVYLHLIKGHTKSEVLTILESIGGAADFSDDKFRLIQAWVPVSKLSVIAGLPAVGSMDLITPPGHNAGPVTSEGDSRLRSDLTRTIFPSATGNGVKVGVMSDDCGSVENLVAPRIVNGELGGGTTVLLDNLAGSRSHEG
ncbi:MAG: hypothetical protein ABI778_00800 [Ignavibacteriota bacterium]